MTDQKSNQNQQPFNNGSSSSDAHVHALTALLAGTHLTPHQATALISTILASSQATAASAGSSGNTNASTGTPTTPATPSGALSQLSAAPSTPQVVMSATPVGEDFEYHIPLLDEEGPFYVVTRGVDVGVFAGWEDTATLVLGIPGSVYRGAPSYDIAIERIEYTLRRNRCALLPAKKVKKFVPVPSPSRQYGQSPRGPPPAGGAGSGMGLTACRYTHPALANSCLATEPWVVKGCITQLKNKPKPVASAKWTTIIVIDTPFHSNRNKLLKKMRVRYAQTTGKGDPIADKSKKKSVSLPESPSKPSLPLVRLCRQLRQHNADLRALTNNSIPNYAKGLCSQITDETDHQACAIVEVALGNLVAIQDEVATTHNAIYTQVGVAKEYTEGEYTVSRVKKAVDYVQDILCHLMEGDLAHAKAERMLAYQRDKSKH
ncbi:hypothetical protein ARMSODRAFT_977841 [Armillaria solidipes]|uniref:Ribonuclease H1 N-terminal domain-containing protein n=1 Tax=Armillaria solidipes TaxID=1076256 RepID=A0A2H3B5Q0_9AGAR|nr:hypothetical protein ARMSODRAFT_977841 [Armillaria solidipes]